MNEEEKKANDVAAVLMGKKRCYRCKGKGHRWYGDKYPCMYCKGTGWNSGKKVGRDYTDSSGPR